jgi:hypothetical protein
MMLITYRVIQYPNWIQNYYFFALSYHYLLQSIIYNNQTKAKHQWKEARETERIKVIALQNQKKSFQQIANETSYPKLGIAPVYEIWEEEGWVKKKEKSGHPPKLDQNSLQHIEEVNDDNPDVMLIAITYNASHNIRVHPYTVGNIWCKKLGLWAFAKPWAEEISKGSMQKRLQFAKEAITSLDQ